MQPIRIHFGYRTTDAPWGGANNFLRSLRAQLALTGAYEFVESPDDECDVILMNQLSSGPGSLIPLDRIMTIANRSGRRLVVRAVNLNRHAFRMGLRNRLIGSRQDREALAVLQAAGTVVFQSEYQRAFFKTAGYAGDRNAVIHNGADHVFWTAVTVERARSSDSLRFATCTMSARATKRHDLIVELAEQRGVEVMHFGNWPDGIAPGRVRLHGVALASRMAAAYAHCDYFFHPAVKDPCPNAVFEAICSGLPVVYHPGPGSSEEIVGLNGLPLNEQDLPETVDRARSLLPTLKEEVLQHREYYRVDRAARQYDELLRAVAGR